jgi:hypothetical protein
MTIGQYKFRHAAAKRMIAKLKKQLCTEIMLTNALRKLAFSPKQNPHHMKVLKKRIKQKEAA